MPQPRPVRSQQPAASSQRTARWSCACSQSTRRQQGRGVLDEARGPAAVTDAHEGARSRETLGPRGRGRRRMPRRRPRAGSQMGSGQRAGAGVRVQQCPREPVSLLPARRQASSSPRSLSRHRAPGRRSSALLPPPPDADLACSLVLRKRRATRSLAGPLLALADSPTHAPPSTAAAKNVERLGYDAPAGRHRQ